MIRRLLGVCLLASALGAFAVPAYASRDAVQFGSTIHVPRDTSIHDAVCFFCGVDADGAVEGDIVVFFGDVHIATNANHDVVNIFGSVRADNEATIGHDLVSIFGAVRLGDDVRIGDDFVALFGSAHLAPTVEIARDRVVQPAWVFWGPLLVFLGIIIVVVHEIRASRRRAYLRNYSYPPRP